MLEKKLITITAVAALICSCAPQSNVVKVLNRVTCVQDLLDSCSQDTIDSIWRLCLKNGYTESMSPMAKVASSRDLRELVSGTVEISYMKQNLTESTDSYGIVTETPSKPTRTTYNREASGYCIGSEYIVY